MTKRFKWWDMKPIDEKLLRLIRLYGAIGLVVVVVSCSLIFG